MQYKKIFLMMIATGFLLVLGTGLWLATAQPVKAQCGSQASSCKNCHEVQAQKPVNNEDRTITPSAHSGPTRSKIALCAAHPRSGSSSPRPKIMRSFRSRVVARLDRACWICVPYPPEKKSM